MSDILKNAIVFLQKRHPHATVGHNVMTFKIVGASSADEPFTSEEFVVWPLIAQDPDSGIKHRAIALEDLGLSWRQLSAVVEKAGSIFHELDKNVLIRFDHAIKQNPIDTTQMTFAPKITLYTNAIHLPYSEVVREFRNVNLMVEVISESDMYRSLFISYGGTDTDAAAEINAYLKNKGIRTWFFPDDALPGEKLHRVMHEEINRHERVLLICSEGSLSRPGVLNEIERVLEREAKEGGSSVLIPVTLDDYVYSDWAPSRQDVAEQIRSRVIVKIDRQPGGKLDSKQLEKLVKALSHSLKLTPPTAASIPPTNQRTFLRVSEQSIDVRITHASINAFLIFVTNNSDEAFDIAGVSVEVEGANLGSVARPSQGTTWSMLPGKGLDVRWPDPCLLMPNLAWRRGKFEADHYTVPIDIIFECVVGGEPRQIKKRLVIQVDPRNKSAIQL